MHLLGTISFSWKVVKPEGVLFIRVCNLVTVTLFSLPCVSQCPSELSVLNHMNYSYLSNNEFVYIAPLHFLHI